jgi:hypothetical protein
MPPSGRVVFALLRLESSSIGGDGEAVSGDWRLGKGVADPVKTMICFGKIDVIVDNSLERRKSG